jgi:hypothetical protein
LKRFKKKKPFGYDNRRAFCLKHKSLKLNYDFLSFKPLCEASASANRGGQQQHVAKFEVKKVMVQK